MKKFLYNKVCKIALKTFMNELEEYREKLEKSGMVHELNVLNTGMVLDLKKLQQIALEKGGEILKNVQKKL